MEAQDILTATHKLEGTDMTRSQSEAIAESIVAAVAPLATRKDLEATRVDVAALKEQMATKADLASLKEQMATKTDIANINTKFEVVNTKIESAKLRFSILFIGLIGSLLTVAFF